MSSDKPPEKPGNKAKTKKPSVREKTKKVKHAKTRKNSSNQWLERHINDPYVHKATREGYRSRAAYKIKEIDEKYKILKAGFSVVDLGAAPGSWCQIAIENKCAPIIAIDLLEMKDFPEVTFLQMDFMDDEAPQKLKDAAGGLVHVVLSDMAPNTTGHRQTDHIRIIGLAEAAYDFAIEILKPGGTFLAKVFQGGTEGELLKRMKDDFTVVRHLKPKASRAESAESYVLATGFRGT